jgi:predicted PurR-regulated permease PerM
MPSSQASRAMFVTLAVAALVLLALLVRPFATALFVAAALAAALSPWVDRLAMLLRGRRRAASGAVTLAVVLVVLAPLGTLVAVLVGQVVGGVAWLKEAFRSEGLAGLVALLPESLRALAERLIEALPQGAEEIQSLVTAQAGKWASALGGVVSATTGVLFQILIFLMALFFLLADGPALVEWLKETVPLRRGQLAVLLEDFRKVTVSLLVSMLATAGVQAVLAFGGYLVSGVPYALAFAVATFVMALVPILGAGAVILPLAVLRFATGHHAAGIFLAAWGLVVVGLVDNVLKPSLMRSGMSMHVAVVFLGLLGGIAAFGPVGLLAGPLIVAFLISVARMYRRDFGGA